MSDLSNRMQDLVRKNGDKVAINEPPCVLWKADHEDCVGCDYELGCGKSVRLLGITIIPMMYTPKDFTDYQRMNNRIQELMDMTLKAKTPDELHEVPFQ